MTKENLTVRQLQVLHLVGSNQPIGCNGIRLMESPELTGPSAAAKSSSIQGVLKRLESLGLIEISLTGGETDKILYALTENKGFPLFQETFSQPETATSLMKVDSNKLDSKEPDIKTLNLEESVECFQVYKSAETHSQWKQAEIANHVFNNSKVWGESSVKHFADEVGITYEYARQISITYQAFSNPLNRVAEFSFSHHRIATLNSSDPIKGIREGGEGWSVRQLENHLKDQNMQLSSGDSSNQNAPEGNNQPIEKGLMTRAVTFKKETVKKIDKLKEVYGETNPDKIVEKVVNDFVSAEDGVKICVIISAEAKADYKFIQDHLHGANEQQIFDFLLTQTVRILKYSSDDVQEQHYEMDGE